MPPPLPSTPATATSFSFASSTTTPGAASSQRAYQHESGAPGGGGGGGLLPTLKARVVFENRPVTEAVVKIELPGRRRASDVTVAVVHEGVDVQVVGAAPLHVSFPFMVCPVFPFPTSQSGTGSCSSSLDEYISLVSSRCTWDASIQDCHDVMRLLLLNAHGKRHPRVHLCSWRTVRDMW